MLHTKINKELKSNHGFANGPICIPNMDSFLSQLSEVSASYFFYTDVVTGKKIKFSDRDEKKIAVDIIFGGFSKWEFFPSLEQLQSDESGRPVLQKPFNCNNLLIPILNLCLSERT